MPVAELVGMPVVEPSPFIGETWSGLPGGRQAGEKTENGVDSLVVVRQAFRGLFLARASLLRRGWMGRGRGKGVSPTDYRFENACPTASLETSWPPARPQLDCLHIAALSYSFFTGRRRRGRPRR